MSTDTVEIEDTELANFRAWRTDQLIKMGLDSDRALHASTMTEFHLGDFRALVSRGCPPETAYDIVK